MRKYCSSLPLGQRARVDPKVPRGLLLRPAANEPVSPEFVSQGSVLWDRQVAQEPPDGWKVSESRAGVTKFPSCDRAVIGADLDRHLFLKQAQI